MNNVKGHITQLDPDIPFRHTLPFSESVALMEILPYLKKTLNLADVKVLPVEVSLKEGPGIAKCIAEPGKPAFEYRAV